MHTFVPLYFQCVFNKSRLFFKKSCFKCLTFHALSEESRVNSSTRSLSSNQHPLLRPSLLAFFWPSRSPLHTRHYHCITALSVCSTCTTIQVNMDEHRLCLFLLLRMIMNKPAYWKLSKDKTKQKGSSVCIHDGSPLALLTIKTEQWEHCIMGARPSRLVKATKVLAVWFLNGINRNTHTHTEIHSITDICTPTHTYTVL